MRISRRKRSEPTDSASSLVHHLEGDGSVVPEVVREVHGRRAAPAEEGQAAVRLPLDPVPVRERRREAFVHQWLATFLCERRRAGRPLGGSESAGMPAMASRARSAGLIDFRTSAWTISGVGAAARPDRLDLASLQRQHRDAVAIQDAVPGHRGDPLARGDDAGQVERVRRAHRDQASAAFQPADRAELAHGVGQRELLARHAGDEPAAPDLTSGLQPAVDHEQLAPGRRPGLPGEQPLEHHAVAAEQRRWRRSSTGSAPPSGCPRRCRGRAAPTGRRSRSRTAPCDAGAGRP